MNVKKIARRAGVPSATAPRVLNNPDYMKEETRQKVLKAVDKYNCVPNVIARSLSVQDSLSVGTIVPDIKNKFFSKVVSGISEVAELYHYNTIFLGTNKTLEKEHDFLKIVENQRLKGVIMTPISEIDTITRDYLLRPEESDVPAVLVDRDVRGAQFDGVFMDNQWGSYDEVMVLIKAGHERAAITAGPETSRPGRDRCQGYLWVVEDNGLSVPEEYVVYGDFKIAKAYECTGRLLKLKGPPTTISTSSSLSTLGCLKYLTKHKIKIGRDIFLMGFDDTDALRMVDYKISVVDGGAREQRREAMRFL